MQVGPDVLGHHGPMGRCLLLGTSHALFSVVLTAASGTMREFCGGWQAGCDRALESGGASPVPGCVFPGLAPGTCSSVLQDLRPSAVPPGGGGGGGCYTLLAGLRACLPFVTVAVHNLNHVQTGVLPVLRGVSSQHAARQEVESRHTPGIE